MDNDIECAQGSRVQRLSRGFILTLWLAFVASHVLGSATARADGPPAGAENRIAVNAESEPGSATAGAGDIAGDTASASDEPDAATARHIAATADPSPGNDNAVADGTSGSPTADNAGTAAGTREQDAGDSASEHSGKVADSDSKVAVSADPAAAASSAADDRRTAQDTETPDHDPPAENPAKVAAGREEHPQDSPASDNTVTDSTSAVYQEQHALFGENFTLETALSYSHYDRRQLVLNGFLALDAILLGNINVDDVSADILTLDFTGRWGITPRFQVDLQVPFLARSTTYQTTGSDSNQQSTTVEKTVSMPPRLGDVSFGGYYQVAPETESRPDIVWSLRAKAPTGTNPYGIENETVDPDGNLTVPKKLPSGNGVWTLSSGLSFIKTTDPLILFGNLTYFHNLEEEFDDISAAEGATPGRIRLGNAFQYGIGTAIAFNRKTSMSFSVSHRLGRASETKVEGGSWEKVVGSDVNSATLNLGLTRAWSNKTSLVYALGIGLTDDAPDFQLSVKVPHGF